MMKKIRLLLFAVILFSIEIGAQDYSKYLEAAKEHLHKGNVRKAEILYNNVYKRVSGKTSPSFERELQKAKFHVDGQTSSPNVSSNSEVSLDTLYSNAKTISDYRYLADNGYAKAYVKLAELYLKDNDYDYADLYAQKALKAKVDTVLAEHIVDILNAYGYYHKD